MLCTFVLYTGSGKEFSMSYNKKNSIKTPLPGYEILALLSFGHVPLDHSSLFKALKHQ